MKNDTYILHVEFEIKENTVFLKKSLGIDNAEAFVKALFEKLNAADYSRLVLNLDQVEQIDSIGVSVIYYLKNKLTGNGVEVSIKGGAEGIRKKLDIFSVENPVSSEKEKKAGLFESLGNSTCVFWNDYVRGFVTLMANVIYWSVSDLFKSKAQRKGEFFNQAVLIGVNAVWIVAAMAYIIGLVLALQSASQLRNFGANIYIVDLTVIAMMSEMGPLITAILVAGRSGSAIAAEIATMKVTSELDALKTMGLNPVRFIVIPKMHGGLLTVPFLTILANVAGIGGGMLVAWLFLDISPQVFINRIPESLHNKDLVTGLIKSLVFTFIIVITGTFFGLSVKQGAEGVGKVTTKAVVASISLVFIADGIMGLIFYWK